MKRAMTMLAFTATLLVLSGCSGGGGDDDTDDGGMPLQSLATVAESEICEQTSEETVPIEVNDLMVADSEAQLDVNATCP